MLKFFIVIELLLKVFHLWESFLEFVSERRIQEDLEKKQERDEAIKELKEAKSEDEFDKAQDKLTRNKP